MLNSTFIVDDDFTLNVVEEPEENCKINSPPNCGENNIVDIKEEVKVQIDNNDITLHVIEDWKDTSDIDTSIKLELDDGVKEEKSDFTPNINEKQSTSNNSPQTDRNINIDSLEGLPPVNKKANFTCSKCGYKTEKYASFLSHIDAHLENQKQYKCKSCDFATFLKAQLSIHKARCNYVHKVFCSECEYVTTKNRHLKRHMEVKHLGIGKKNFRCAKCNFRSQNQEEIKKHRSETHPKPRYKCEKCDFETENKLALKRHVNAHNGKIPIKRTIHKCEVCDFHHSNKKIIRRHIRIHHKMVPRKDLLVKSGKKSMTEQAEINEKRDVERLPTDLIKCGEKV